MNVHLVVGAGSVGSAVARQLAGQGSQVVVVTRSGSGPEGPGIKRVAANASSVDALTEAAPAAVAIYNCANPAYHRCAQDWPPMASAFLAYAGAQWPQSIWYKRQWSTTVKCTIDGLVYALVTAGIFGWLWPR